MSGGERPSRGADRETPLSTNPEDWPEAAIPDLQSALLSWYEESARSFPWRNTTDPYPILVCEVMSQQTQLERIVESWRAFLQRWPNPADLAKADRADVVAFWTENALGYNNRARYLHEAAVHIVEEWDGDWPTDPDALQALPGVGPYTGNAVASFAFNTGDAVLDTNVRRVLHRLVTADDPSEQTYARIAGALLPPNRSRRWNNALMELGAEVCTASPRCDDEPCPFRERCGAYAVGDFTAPDVPSQPTFEGSRRQYRGRVIRALAEHGPLPLNDLGPRVSVEYGAEGGHDRGWLADLLADLEADGLVVVEGDSPGERARLPD